MTTFSLSTFLRERFLRDHGHLISPWDCKPSEAVTLTEMLRRRNWLYWEKKRFDAEVTRGYTHIVIPMGTIPEGPVKDHYEQLNREAMEVTDD